MGEQLQKILHQINSWPHFISYTGNKDQLPEKCAQGVRIWRWISQNATHYTQKSLAKILWPDLSIYLSFFVQI